MSVEDVLEAIHAHKSKRNSKKQKQLRRFLVGQYNQKRELMRCRWCGKVLTSETATFDHRIPLSKGGLTNSANAVLACADCNHRKADLTPEEFKAKDLSR